MPSLVLIGPAVRPAIGNRQTNKHIAFYMLDESRLVIFGSPDTFQYLWHTDEVGCELLATTYTRSFAASLVLLLLHEVAKFPTEPLVHSNTAVK